MYFVYDEVGHLIGEYDNAGALIKETLWFEDIPVAVLKPNGSGGVNVFYLHTDHLNTPRRISRPSDNAIIWRWDADPFGTTAVNEDPDGDSNLFVYDLRFPGQYFDSETGLHYNYFRDYDPAVGRYVQSDPIGLRGGLNTYAYVGGNPLSFADPLSLCRCRAKGDTGQKIHQARNVWGGWLGSRHVVTCTYECETSDGTRTDIVGSHYEWYFLSTNYDDGREGQCLGAYFPDPEYNYNLMRAVYARDRFDWFDPEDSGSEELERWAENACKCEK